MQEAPRLHYALLLLLEAATLGIFCALDTVLFFVFWEATLVPLYFLLGRWGVTAGAAAAATRYFLIMLGGGIPLLLAFVVLAASQAVPTFDLTTLMTVPLPRATQMAVFLLCLVGFGVKVPLVPLHTWLPQFALAAPGSLTALLVGLKLGAFGLIRFAVPLAPGGGDGFALAVGRAGYRRHHLRRRRHAGANQSARQSGLCQHLPRRAGRTRAGRLHRAGGTGRDIVAAQLFRGERRRFPVPRVPAPTHGIKRYPCAGWGGARACRCWLRAS